MCWLLAGSSLAWSATINASSCAQSAVQSAINSASHGDTVAVPAGSCSWSGLTVNKAIHLRGAGIGQTVITLSGNNSLGKQSAGVIRVTGFDFRKSGGGNASKGFTVGGAWRGAEPVIFEGNAFTVSNSGLFLVTVAGGWIFAGNSVTASYDDQVIQIKNNNDSDNSWGTAHTMGTADTSGTLNHYIENNEFYGAPNGNTDNDDGARIVYRYNTLTFSSVNSHGADTSTWGVRHFEIYHNTFKHTGGCSDLANQNWSIWMRGATGVIFNNQLADIAGSCWGNKPELKFSIRGAEDVRPQGSCSNVRYPVPRQLGQNHNGNQYFTDPIYIWGNTGTLGISAGWDWGNPCGLSFSDFWQSGRDYVNGSARPGYSAYPYPHPLRTGGGGSPPPTPDTTAPTVPGNLSPTVASSAQINLTWNTSTDNVGVTGYLVERCQGSSCTNFSQIGTPSTTSYSDTGLTAGTAYRYRVRARDAAGNNSAYSSIASATTQAAAGDVTAPSVPTGLSAAAASASQISLNWNASTDNVGVTGYLVERCQGASCTNFSQIATPSSTAQSDTGLTGGTTYRYRVRARDAAGNTSGYSSIASATTQAAGDTTAPSVPSGLSAAAASTSRINLTWNASTDNVGVTGYRLERCQGSSCTNYSEIATSSGTSYADTGLAASTAYRYRVRARDAAGNNSGYSTAVSATTQSASTPTPSPLPEGNTGIAALYSLDANIQSHPDVIFADNFESYSTASQLTTRWNQAYQLQYTRIATESGNVFSGTKSLEFRIPQQSAEVSNELVKTISPGEDVIFVRAYTKFEAGYNASGSTHNGIVISSNYSSPGVPATGTNKYLVDVENSREGTSETSPGLTNFYVYHPEQRTEWGDHWYPDGRVTPFDATPGDFGAHFVPRPNFTPELGRWYCYELMVKANTPGQRDGRIALWIDGQIIADYPNVRLRDVSSLTIDKILLSFHIKSNTTRQNMKWYDNVVVSRAYIGPMSGPASVAPPSGLQATVQ